AENRATGGYFDLPKLVRVLRGDYELRDYSDFAADWKRLEAVSYENVSSVRSVIGHNIRLARTPETDAISTELAGNDTVMIVGESGSGKSVLVSQLLARNDGPFKRILWLSATQLSKASQAEVAGVLKLRHNIPELIGNSSVRNCILVLD